MKKFLFFVSLAAFCLTGCLDTVEDVTINENGSGVYKTSVDMSGLFDMLQMAAMMDTSAASNSIQQLADKDIDSTISLRSFTDTATKLSAEEKALLKDATMKINVSQKEKVFKITMNYPFKKTEDIEKILKLQASDKGFNPMSNSQESNSMGDMGGDKGLPSATDFMKMSFENGKIERKVDQKKLEEMKNSEEMKSAPQMESMMSQVTFTTVIHLPKPVKSIKGDKLTISDDKKTVRMNYSAADLMKNPASLEFKLEY